MIPRWITYASIAIVTLAFFVGCTLYISPGTIIPYIDFTSPDVQYLTNMLAAGHIALACVVAFSLYRRSASMLIASLLSYSLTNLQSLFIGLAKSDSRLIISAGVLFLLSAILIYGLRNIKENSF